MTSEFERVALVWCENESLPAQPAHPPSVGVALWKDVLPCTLLRWQEHNPPDFSRWDIYLCNLFHTPDSVHPTQIRAARPDALIVAMPDANIDLTLMSPDWVNLWEQIAVCDLVAGRTQQDCQVYGSFFGKPAVWLPSPIHPIDHFASFRDTPKEPFILTQDHSMHDGLFQQNVAALALIQRETGMRVVYASARDWTPRYARLAGLQAEFVGQVPFFDFVTLTARAKLFVDMSLRHSYGRQAILCAAVGTPMVGSEYSLYTGHPQVDPLDPEAALLSAARLLAMQSYYSEVQEDGYAVVEQTYGAEACRHRVRQLIAEYAKVGV